MMSEDETQGPDHHHDEKDWDAQKENFRVCYLDQNMTRKDAAQYVKDHFGFDATPRQWERRIKQWGFTKYSSREDRLQQIAYTGKSVFEVSRPGRRPRSHDFGKLHPHEDRNLRRFARREVSRSRSRSRSNSFTGRPRPTFLEERLDGPSEAITDQTFNLHLAHPALLGVPHNGGFTVAATPAAGEPEQPIQLHLLHEQQSSVFGEPNEPDLFLTVDNNPFDTAGEGDPFPTFPDDLMSTQGGLMGGTSNANLVFPLNAHDSSLNYTSPDHAMSTNYNQYAMSANTMPPIGSGVLTDDMMGGQQMFDNTVQLPRGSGVLDQPDFNGNPIFTFDVVDTDSSTMLPQGNEADFQAIASMTEAVPRSAVDVNDPMQQDVVPLVEEYTRAVHAATLWCLSNHQYNDGLGDKLAASLDPPGQIFTARMSVVLDNFAKSQQRAFQSMRDTCSKLRQKNAVLEEIINGGGQIPSGPPPSSRQHPQHQIQAPGYGNVFSANF